MPKKQTRTEAEIHAMIVVDAKMRVGCADFAPVFTLRRAEIDATRYPSANWEVHELHNAETWAADCTQAFTEAVARARRKFDIAWPR